MSYIKYNTESRVKMNNSLASFCQAGFKGKFLKTCTVTYSILRLSRWQSTLSTKYAVYEPEKKLYNSNTTIKDQKSDDAPKTSVTIQKLLNQDSNACCAPSVLHQSQTMSDFKQRLEDLNISVNKTLTDIKPSDSSIENIDTYVKSNTLNAVESITFFNDLKNIVPLKPSPLLGTEDRNIPPSKEPCTGCGATLQCQHRTFPGFLPSEFFKMLTPSELKTVLCQRCYYIRNCDAFQEVSTSAEEFSSLIGKIKPTKSVVVMVVDVMDIQGSIIPNLMDYIGNNHPVVIVGNKADLLCPDSPEYIKNVTLTLRHECHKAGIKNIKNCKLISAKTGFGIEKLISSLFTFYKQKVDIYIVGTANAGKSSLFNALLASDYCKHTARDLIQRATISVWPGTTLNLLKFPIMRPSSRTNALRVIRLKQKQAQKLAEKESRERTAYKTEKESTWELKDEVEITDVRTIAQFKADEKGSSWGQEIGGFVGRGDSVQIMGGPEKGPAYDPGDYRESYWTYDTPGLINPNQILNLLTPEEAPFIAPKTMLVPQCVLLNPGDTIFVSGLARLDYLEGDISVMFTVHCGPEIPLVVLPTQEADQFYTDSLGTEKLGIPLGDKKRLSRLPSLCGKEFIVENLNKSNISSSDIQLSSLGWISIASKSKQCIKVKAYTPGGIGLNQRSPALFQNDTVYRGKKIPNSPFFLTKPPGSIMAKGNVELIED
ncbi:nitric oxide associated protein 1 [Bulinus truncatus]|nr:nitric oxide associated protein 1 [Bulinus truncatus]